MRFQIGMVAAIAAALLVPQVIFAGEGRPDSGGGARTAAVQTKEADKGSTVSSGSNSLLLPPLIWGSRNEWKLQMSGDVRVRLEHRDNWDMNDDRSDDGSITFMRSRLNFDLTYDSFVRAFVTIMDSRQFGVRPLESGGIDPMQEDHFDVLQAFLEFHRQNSPWTLRIGRQNLPNLGENRLIETTSWSNLQRAFEGAWLTHKTKQSEIHMFLVQELIYQTCRGEETITDRMHNRNHEWFYGVYGTFTYLDPHQFDLYFLGITDHNAERTFPSKVTSESGRFGTSDRYTIGTRWRGPVWKDERGTLGCGLEGAYQFGHKSNDEISAYMLHADLNYTWNQAWKPKVALEGNLASGDRDPVDGENDTFSPLYGTSHSPYGIIDFVRLSNLREIALWGQIEPNNRTKLRLEAHKFWLDSPSDGWYSAVPGSYPRDKTGASGRELGSEIDLVGTHKLNKWTSLEAGAAHFMPGAFAEKHGREDAANYLYVQTVFTF